MAIAEIQKQRAIDTHSEQARLFASRYEVIRQDPYQNCFVYSRKRLNEWLDKFLPARGDGLQMLDVGCGTGYHLERYRMRGFALTGVDGSGDMLQQARAVNPDITFHQSDVDRLPVADGAFDMALCIEVLRYLPDIQPCVREIHRALRTGGTAFVTAAPPLQANAYPPINWLATALQLKSLTALKQYFHSVGELERHFRAAGFCEVEVYGVYGGGLIWLERVLPAAAMPSLLRGWEKIDDLTANAPVLRHFSNMLLVRAVK